MAVQVAMAYAVRNASWWKVLVAAYVVSGTASQNLFTAQHELSHFLAFRKPLYNKMLSLASNCPLVVPMATSFRKYHQEHHSHLVGVFASLWHEYNGSCLQCCIQLHASQCCTQLHAWLPHADLSDAFWTVCGTPAVLANLCSCKCVHSLANSLFSLLSFKRTWTAQGVDGWDVDLPTYLEANWITSFVAKAAWVLVYIIVYGLRPVLIRPKPIGESSPT